MPKLPRRIELDVPLLVLLGWVAWRYGIVQTSLWMAWTMVGVGLLSIAALSLCLTQLGERIAVRLGGLSVGRIDQGQSLSTRLTAMLGALALMYLGLFGGYPLVLVAALPLLLEFVPYTPSVWDEYLSDVLRRATVQAGFVAMLATALVGLGGTGALEVLAVAVGSYLLTLQLFMLRWNKLTRTAD